MSAKKRKRQLRHKACVKKLIGFATMPEEEAMECMMGMPNIPYGSRLVSIRDYVNVGCFGIYVIRGKLYRGWAKPERVHE